MRPKLQLGLATVAQIATSAAMNGPAFLIPTLHANGLSLAEAGAVAAATKAGGICTLAPWGAAADAFGERLALTASLGSTALFVGLSMGVTHSPVLLAALLFLVGAGAAGTNSASGRVVVGSFPAHRRGVAMGIRQMAQPVGVGLAAFAIPVAAQHGGLNAALAVPLVLCAICALACGIGIRDPERPASSPETAANPYRGSNYLARIHAVSILLVIPQFAVWTFMLVWLQIGRHWSPEAAGLLVAVAQVLGGLGRVGSGWISDRVGARMQPLRWIALLAGATMLALGATMQLDWGIAVPLIVVASVLTVADNGLAYTAVAEYAGPFWSGRALGVQNTGQYVAAAALPPLMGAAIPALGYGMAFGLTGLLPLVALPLVPKRDEAWSAGEI